MMKIVKNNAFLLIICAMILAVASSATVSPYSLITGSARRLALAEMRGDGLKQLICGLYQASVSGVDPAYSRTQGKSAPLRIPYQSGFKMLVCRYAPTGALRILEAKSR